jgi:hypothetical protein
VLPSPYSKVTRSSARKHRATHPIDGRQLAVSTSVSKPYARRAAKMPRVRRGCQEMRAGKSVPAGFCCTVRGPSDGKMR